MRQSLALLTLSTSWAGRTADYDVTQEVDFIFKAARERETWVDGRYVTFDEYVRRITPEMVAKAIAEFDEAMRTGREEEPRS